MNRAQRRHLGPEPKTSNVSEIESLLIDALEQVNRYLFDQAAPDAVINAMTTIETHCAVSLRLMAKTPPSRIKAEAVTFEISQRLAGKPEMV